jgi:hypothetical protein
MLESACQAQKNRHPATGGMPYIFKAFLKTLPTLLFCLPAAGLPTGR